MNTKPSAPVFISSFILLYHRGAPTQTVCCIWSKLSQMSSVFFSFHTKLHHRAVHHLLTRMNPSQLKQQLAAYRKVSCIKELIVIFVGHIPVSLTSCLFPLSDQSMQFRLQTYVMFIVQNKTVVQIKFCYLVMFKPLVCLTWTWTLAELGPWFYTLRRWLGMIHRFLLGHNGKREETQSALYVVLQS